MSDWQPDYAQLANQARQAPLNATARNTADAARFLGDTVDKLDTSVQLQLETLRQTQAAAEASEASSKRSEASAKRSMRHSLITGYTSVGLGVASLAVAVIALVTATGS